MRVLIAGIDGYLGWALTSYLLARGYWVGGIDNGARRKWVREMGSDSAIPIGSKSQRANTLLKFGESRAFYVGDLQNEQLVRDILSKSKPDAIVYLGEQPSAPYSMIDCERAVYTQWNNVVGTLVMLHTMRDICPEAHLIKLGSMGEYGTPNSIIPEGYFPGGSAWTSGGLDHHAIQGNLSGLMFPRRAGSIYHLSKVHDTHNVEFACRTWGMRSTDVMQGVVYGTRHGGMGDELRWATRFDFDQCFGTVINRFVAQAIIGLPITPYGKGLQQRGFLPLADSMECLTLALENPPEAGEYRTFNQFAQTYTIQELAKVVWTVAGEFNLKPQIRHLENPRQEAEEHYYKPVCENLKRLGYQPQVDLYEQLRQMFEDLLPYEARIEAHREACFPNVQWSGRREHSGYIMDPLVG